DDRRLEAAESLLKERGLSPDLVGEQVPAAVRTGALDAITDRYTAPVLEQRFRDSDRSMMSTRSWRTDHDGERGRPGPDRSVEAAEPRALLAARAAPGGGLPGH